MSNETLLVDVAEAEIVVSKRLRVSAPKFKIRSGTISVLVGPNGSGKSTFGRFLCNIEGGEAISCTRVQIPRPNAIMVWQSLNLFPMTVRRNVSIVRKEGFEAGLKYFNLWMLRERNADHLSGGERQKLAIVRGMIIGAELVVLDEPTSSLDNRSVEDLVDIVGAYTGVDCARTKDFMESLPPCGNGGEARRAIFIITHDLRFVRLLSRFSSLRVFSLSGREVVGEGEAHFSVNGGDSGEGYTVDTVHTRPEDLFTADFFGVPNVIGFTSAVGMPRGSGDFCSRFAQEAVGWVVLKDEAITIMCGEPAPSDVVWKGKLVGVEYSGIQRRLRITVSGAHGPYELTVPSGAIPEGALDFFVILDLKPESRWSVIEA